VGRHSSRDEPAVPRPVIAWAVASSSALVIGLTYWFAVQPGAAEAQTGLVTWINDPPQPLGALLAVTNALFRPVPLTVVALILIGWIVFTAGSGPRWEMLRAMVVSVALCELIAQTLKRLADQPRPTASIPGLDVHGYPKDPYGNAYPSAHTSVAVGLVASLWPWLTWPQRVVGVAVAALVALNRLYIGAHWPVDVVGGVAIGLLSGSLCWLIGARWPFNRREGGLAVG
jgi:membrane-associated phospholipid phosphatase